MGKTCRAWLFQHSWKPVVILQPLSPCIHTALHQSKELHKVHSLCKLPSLPEFTSPFPVSDVGRLVWELGIPLGRTVRSSSRFLILN